MFFIAYAFKGHVHVFAGRVKVVSHLSCRTSAIFKYFCPSDKEHNSLGIFFAFFSQLFIDNYNGLAQIIKEI